MMHLMSAGNLEVCTFWHQKHHAEASKMQHRGALRPLPEEKALSVEQLLAHPAHEQENFGPHHR